MQLTNYITPRRVTCGGAYFHGLAPAGQHSSEKTSQGGDIVSI